MRRDKKKNEDHADESWLIPYSDLLTLCLALFIVLFAMSKIDQSKYEALAQVFESEFSHASGILDGNDSIAELPKKSISEEDPRPEFNLDKDKDKEEDKKREELEQLKNLQAKIDDYIKSNKLSEKLGTKLTDEGLLITILNDVFFESGSAAVKAKGNEIAGEVSKFLYTNPPHQIVVSGHADDVPIHNANFDSNWELSVIRAVNFMKLVLKNDDLTPDNFSAKGYGDTRPIVPNTTPANRAKNRRVEVLILPNYDIDTSK